ncbi:MAG: hypothetical protein K1Y36_06785 [Blastocatellia bacterium]|nr:hypothetical protein [Blastocatellia bacterium]
MVIDILAAEFSPDHTVLPECLPRPTTLGILGVCRGRGSLSRKLKTPPPTLSSNRAG